MRIRIFNKGDRNQLVCERRDKKDEIADLGPKLPFHDIAHFIVERHFKLSNGFFGNIYSGYSVKELSDREIIKTLSKESVVSEVAARALQSLSAGACSLECFRELIVEELLLDSVQFPYDIDQKEVTSMYLAYQSLITKWQGLKEGGVLELELDIEK
jgi:hypothetical protein